MAQNEKPAFSFMNSVLNVTSQKEASRKKISYKDLVDNERNHYSMDEIGFLADSIELLGGIDQTPTVKPIGGGKYKIIAGHRRKEAVKLLVEEKGLDEYELIDCKLVDADEDETISEFRLHLTNLTTRELSDHDMMLAIEAMTRLINEAKDKGIEVKGKIRDIIAGQIGLGKSQVQKYITVAASAPQDVKEALKDKKIGIEKAYQNVINDKTDVLSQKPRASVERINDFEQVYSSDDIDEAIKRFDQFKQIGDAIRNPIILSLIQKMDKQLKKLFNESIG